MKRMIGGYTLLLIACGCVSFYLDSKLKYNLPDNFNDITKILMSCTIALLAVLCALYYIYIQIYINRYPSKLIGKKFNKPIIATSIVILINVTIGILISTFLGGYFRSIAYWVISIISFFGLVLLTIMSTRWLAISKYVEKYVESTKSIIDKFPDKKNLNNTLKELYQIFEECVTKHELYIAQQISKSTGEILDEFLTEINGHIITKKIEEEEALELGNTIFRHACQQIQCLSGDIAPQFERTILYAPINYLITCCNIGQYSLFKEFVNILSIRLYHLQSNQSQDLASKMYQCLEDLIDQLVTKNDRTEWLEYLCNELLEMMITYTYLNNSHNIRNYARFIAYCLEVSDEESYKSIFEIFKKFTTFSAKSTQDFNQISVYYIRYTKKLIDSKNTNKINDLFELIKSSQQEMISDERWTEFLFYFISTVSEELPEYRKELRKTNISVIADLISIDDGYLRSINIMMPNYTDHIKENIKNIDEIKEISGDFKYLLAQAIHRNNEGIYYIFLENLNKCLALPDKSDKAVQEELLGVYDYALYKVCSVNNLVFPEMTLSMLRTVIKKMDNERRISKELGYRIIKTLEAHATHGSMITDFMRDYIIEELHDWYSDEDYAKTFVLSDFEAKKLLLKSLYLIGLDCIEYGKEESLRKVSNAMGWSIIRSLKQSENDIIIKQLIGHVQTIYQIAQKMHISASTRLFLLTLYTTVGTFCETAPFYLRYQQSILTFLSSEEYELVEAAMQIRTSENDSWDSLFNNHTREYTYKFLKKLRDLKKDVSTKSSFY